MIHNYHEILFSKEKSPSCLATDGPCRLPRAESTIHRQDTHRATAPELAAPGAAKHQYRLWMEAHPVRRARPYSLRADIAITLPCHGCADASCQAGRRSVTLHMTARHSSSFTISEVACHETPKKRRRPPTMWRRLTRNITLKLQRERKGALRLLSVFFEVMALL